MNPTDANHPDEGVPPRIKIILIALCVLLVIAGVFAMVLEKREVGLRSDAAVVFYDRVQKSPEKDLHFEFQSTREIPAGVGLRDWFAAMPAKDSIQSLRAEAIVTYMIDPKGDWDLQQKNGQVLIRVPLPEVRSVIIAPEKLQIVGPALSPEDRQAAQDIASEKMPLLMREDEDTRFKERSESIRQSLKKLAADTLHIDEKTIQVFFPTERSAGEEGP